MAVVVDRHMSEPTDPAVAVRAFAMWTTQAATLLECSYEDAAVFLMKVGQLVPLMQDATFQAQLLRYYAAVKMQPIILPGETPQDKAVH